MSNILLDINPKLAKEWHPTRNGDLTPDHITCGSIKKVWWLCTKGHEWEAFIINRNRGNGCPYCSGRRAIKGKTDLCATNLKLANEWHPTKNGNLTASDVTGSSGKKVWWQCANEHEWKARIQHRNKGSGCPYCSGYRAIEGKTDLLTTNPELANEWHPTNNGSLTPSDVLPYSSKKVWWICANGHEWEASISNRNNGNGCPYCSNKKVLRGFNDLATTNIKLASEWHPTRNGKLSSRHVTRSSSKKVWWLCGEGHEWEASIANRNRGNGCPYCSGHKAVKGYINLFVINPKLASEWHPTKNGSLMPDYITCGSAKKVWWQCAKGHDWTATIDSRDNGNDCPYCHDSLSTMANETSAEDTKKINLEDAEWY